MPKHTLTVPAEFAEEFRAAVLHEIKLGSERIKLESGDDSAIADGSRSADLLTADMRCMVSQLSGDVDLFGQFPVTIDETVTLQSSDLGAFAHAAETMAREVVGPRLASALQYGPMDAEQAIENLSLIEKLSWAVDRAEEFHAAAIAEREAERSAA